MERGGNKHVQATDSNSKADNGNVKAGEQPGESDIKRDEETRQTNNRESIQCKSDILREDDISIFED